MINATPRSGRRGPRLLLALALGGAAAAGVYLYVSSVQQTAAQTARAAAQQAAVAAVTPRSRVVVAKVTLPAQTPLSADNVEVREVSPDAIQPNAAAALSEVQGKALSLPVAANQQILTPFLANPDQPDI